MQWVIQYELGKLWIIFFSLINACSYIQEIGITSIFYDISINGKVTYCDIGILKISLWSMSSLAVYSLLNAGRFCGRNSSSKFSLYVYDD